MDIPLFLLATLALNLTPGPDMLYVIARSVGQGRRAGVVSALRIGAGTLVHMAALALGLTTLLVSVPGAYDAVKYIGAAYLAYLGVRTLISKGAEQDVIEGGAEQEEQPGYWTIFRQGVITNVLNPKVALFFIAFIPQFVHPDLGPVGWQVVMLGLIFDVSGTLVNCAVALLAGVLGEHMKRNTRFSTFQRRFTGVVFLGLAARLVWPERT